MSSMIMYIILSVFVWQLLRVDAQTYINYVKGGCDGEFGNYTEGSVYQKNLNQLFTDLSSQTLSRKFHNTTAGAAPNRVYGLYQCRQDLSPEVCKGCIEDATQKIVQVCNLYGEAIVYYGECMLRYANRSIFSSYQMSPSVYSWVSGNVSSDGPFLQTLADTMRSVINRAVASTPSGHFATGDDNFTLIDRVYCLAQCTPDLDRFGCSSCLKSALAEMNACCRASIRTMVFLPSCHLRYDLSEFYNVTTNAEPAAPPSIGPGISDGPDGPGKGLKPSIIAAIAVGASAGFFIMLLIGLWLYLRPRRPEVPLEASTVTPPEASKQSDNFQGDESNGLGDDEFVQYDLATLNAATCDFSNDNMLGQGGFGIVYKGRLSSGQEIAVKRLSSGSGQGAKEFMTEAQLVAKLQHKNLVKLLGFYSEGDKKMLVYEFLPNSSVDRYLFDPQKRATLYWERRYKIILGIARGLQYLHEDSRLTIIHRDLKPGNILLDNEMNPKIADFGLAKLFGVDQRLGNTSRIVGTFGYMAPEYIMTGEYSDKSDVYSFGIMILELVSGQKNRTNYNSPQKEDIRNLAWRLWNAGRSFEFMDPSLYNNAVSNEVMRCIQIGLLCVQEDAEQRPTMGTVVLMLTGSVALPLPPKPLMSPHQSSVPIYECDIQSNEPDQSMSKSVSWGAEAEQDLYPR